MRMQRQQSATTTTTTTTTTSGDSDSDVTTTTTAVSSSLDGLVLRRMRDTALQKWQSNTTTTNNNSNGAVAETSFSQHSQEESPPHPLCETTSTATEESSAPFSCPLCFEDKHDASSEVCVLTRCCHQFCIDCMTKWVSSSSPLPDRYYHSTPSCPLCRIPLTSNEMDAFLCRCTTTTTAAATNPATTIDGDDDDDGWEEDHENMMVDAYDEEDYVHPLTISPRIITPPPETNHDYDHDTYPSPNVTTIETERFSFMGWF